jgi:hypothetical protein
MEMYIEGHFSISMKIKVIPVTGVYQETMRVYEA